MKCCLNDVTALLWHSISLVVFYFLGVSSLQNAGYETAITGLFPTDIYDTCVRIFVNLEFLDSNVKSWSPRVSIPKNFPLRRQEDPQPPLQAGVLSGDGFTRHLS